MVLRYMALAGMDTKSFDFLIRRKVFHKKSNSYSVGSKALGSLGSRCREIFLESLRALGYDLKDYGLHSLRSGGATAAHTVSERLKLHGRWKSDHVKDLYR